MEPKSLKTLKSKSQTFSKDELSECLGNSLSTVPGKKIYKITNDSKLADNEDIGHGASKETADESKLEFFVSEGILKFKPALPTIFEEQLGYGNGGAISKQGNADLSDCEETEYAGVKSIPSTLCYILKERCIIAKKMYGSFLMEKEKQRIIHLYSEEDSTLLISEGVASVFMRSKNLVWMELFYGVPVAILSTAGPNKMLSLIITERATGFELCKFDIDWKSGFARENSTIYSMTICHEHSSRMELCFEDDEAATDFWVEICRMTSQLENLRFSKVHSSLDQWFACGTPSDFKSCNPNCFNQLNQMRPENFNRHLSHHRDFLLQKNDRVDAIGEDW